MPSRMETGSMDAVVQTHGIKTPRDRFQAALATDGVLSDSLFLFLIVSLSVVLYVGHLGFYSDDWSFLETLSFSNDQSLPGLFKTFFTRHHTVWTRPVQGIYQALLYWLFGFHPLAYHLVNSAVLLSGILLFYWVLRELCCSRYLAVSLPA